MVAWSLASGSYAQTRDAFVLAYPRRQRRHFRTRVATGERPAQRKEKRFALRPLCSLSADVNADHGSLDQSICEATSAATLKECRIVGVDVVDHYFAVEDRDPVVELAEMVDVAGEDGPFIRSDPARDPVGDGGEIEMVKQLAIDLFDLGNVEMCRCAPNVERSNPSASSARVAFASTGCEVPSRARRLLSAIGSIPTSFSTSTPLEPSRFDNLPSAATSNASWPRSAMAHRARRTTGSDRAVRDMVLPAQDVADPHVDVVDHGGSR